MFTWYWEIIMGQIFFYYLHVYLHSTFYLYKVYKMPTDLQNLICFAKKKLKFKINTFHESVELLLKENLLERIILRILINESSRWTLKILKKIKGWYFVVKKICEIQPLKCTLMAIILKILDFAFSPIP